MIEELLVISFFLCYDLLEFNKEGCSVRFNEFPVIDQIATGKNILSLRKEKGLSVKDLQEYFGFEEPQAIYRWQYGKTLPSVDNLYALSALLDVPMERILVPVPNRNNVINMKKQQEIPAAFGFYAASIKKLVSVKLISFSDRGLPMTSTTSASSASQIVAFCAAMRDSR